MQLRLLQTVVEVAAEKNSTLVMPFPVELLRFLERATNHSVHDLQPGLPTPMPVDEAVEVYVEVFPVGAVLKKGHTLRMTVQPADAPHLTPSAPQADAARTVLAKVAVKR